MYAESSSKNPAQGQNQGKNDKSIKLVLIYRRKKPFIIFDRNRPPEPSLQFLEVGRMEGGAASDGVSESRNSISPSFIEETLVVRKPK